MSKYVECETEFTNPSFLAAALTKLGFKPVSYLTPQHLFGYHGDQREETAILVIPRDQIGSSANDIGFEFTTQGNLQAHISQYDQRCGYNDRWLDKLKDGYYEEEVLSNASEQGYVLQGRETLADGTIELKFGMPGE